MLVLLVAMVSIQDQDMGDLIDEGLLSVSHSKKTKMACAVVGSKHLCVLVKAYHKHFNKYSQNCKNMLQVLPDWYGR
jgi:hypothetical protein